jgi:putative salt-induced outer membrane protein YdiY
MKYFSVWLLLCFAILFSSTGVARAQFIREDYFDGMIQPSEDWDGSFAFGVNGTSGNSENSNLNLTVDAKREDDVGITDILLTYFYASNDIATTTDQIFAQARHERKLANPNFTWWFSGFYQRDRFTNFDYRIGAHTGLGILLYEFDDRFLKFRSGAGASREVGGVNDEWIPELQFGLDWERRLTDRTKLFATVDVFPNVQDFSDYRANTEAGIETLLDEALDMRLRAFLLNRYDSTPDPGNVSNDVNYGLSLVFGF